MKTITTITLNVFLFLGIISGLIAQEIENPQDAFTEKEWYLSKLVLNGEEMPFVSNDFPEQIILYAEIFENNAYLSIDACDWGLSDLYFTEENQFEIGAFMFLASNENECNADLWNYHFLLFNDFWMPANYEYSIFQMENYQQLIIENPQGDKTYYQSIPYLSVEQNEFSNLTIYPNPAKGSFQIENLTEKSILKIYDLSGKEIFEQTIHSSAENIEVTQLSSGLYFYGIFQEGKSVKTGKLIKE